MGEEPRAEVVVEEVVTEVVKAAVVLLPLMLLSAGWSTSMRVRA